MPPKRYEGLGSDITPSVISQGFNETPVNTASCALTHDTYQLGWHSAVFGYMSEGKLCGLSVKDCDTETPAQSLGGAVYDQIVTRGVASCTGVVVTKGPLFCFMHLDEPNVDLDKPSDPKPAQLLRDIEGFFRAGTVPAPIAEAAAAESATLFISRVSPISADKTIPEQRFDERLQEIVRGMDGERVRVGLGALEEPEGRMGQFMDRNAVLPPGPMGHLELGICAEAGRGQMTIFGDCTRIIDREYVLSEFAFAPQAPQAAVDASMALPIRSAPAPKKSSGCVIM